ncbi:BspA family leucine-rich repeat surface protein, partial [Muribaculum intestinale]|uniref:BspA family leucine-rich repeat surface protein n=1 Tax=Muribaculum intestinale TaxID=1796646 RepID=UPI0025B612D1
KGVSPACPKGSNSRAFSTLDLSMFDTSRVKDMSRMFYECVSLETVDLSSFDLRRAESTEEMFARCDRLHTVFMKNCSDQTVGRISKELPPSVKIIR